MKTLKSDNKKKVKKTDYKYDFSIKGKEERAEFIEDKIGYILNLPAHTLMGYSGSSRSSEGKWNKIPNMIDTYTSYFLRANDTGSSRNTEYSYYVDRNAEMLRKNNRVYHHAESFEGSQKDEDVPNHAETYTEDNIFEACSVESDIIKYTILNNKLNVAGYKKLLSSSAEILYTSDDIDLKDMVEQVIFNCRMSCRDDIDDMILKEYILGATMREVAESVDMSHVSVSKRLNRMLSWVIG